MPRLIDRSIGWLAPFPGCFIEIFFAFSKLFLAVSNFCVRGLNSEGSVRGERGILQKSGGLGFRVCLQHE